MSEVATSKVEPSASSWQFSQRRFSWVGSEAIRREQSNPGSLLEVHGKHELQVDRRPGHKLRSKAIRRDPLPTTIKP